MTFPASSNIAPKRSLTRYPQAFRLSVCSTASCFRLDYISHVNVKPISFLLRLKLVRRINVTAPLAKAWGIASVHYTRGVVRLLLFGTQRWMLGYKLYNLYMTDINCIKNIMFCMKSQREYNYFQLAFVAQLRIVRF